MKTKEFAIGLIVGAIIGTLAALTIAKSSSLNTYEIYSERQLVIKLNKRTGETWRAKSGGWEPYGNSN